MNIYRSDIMNQKEMLEKGYYCNEENAKKIEDLVKKYQNRTERIK